MTGETPARLLMGRNLKVKLPQLEQSMANETWDMARQRDQREKQQLKIRTDNKKNAKPIDVGVGDKVLLKQNKLDKLNKIRP